MRALLLLLPLFFFACGANQASTTPSKSVDTLNTASYDTLIPQSPIREETFEIATAIPALYSISQELVRGSKIRVLNGLEGDITLDEYESYYVDRESLLDSLGQTVQGVLTLRSVIPSDMLYLKLRQRNIKVVEIDCATPDNPVIGALGKSHFSDGEINPYMWLAPTNAIRMSEIMASDLSNLFPSQQDIIAENLKTFKTNLLKLKLFYDSLYLELPHFDAAVMDHNFDYLLKDIDLYVVTSYPQEIDWDSTITETFKNDIDHKRFATIVHQWEPFGDPIEIATAQGITFSVLTPGLPAGDHYNNGFIAFMKGNLEALYQGLKSSSLNQ